MVKPLLLYYFTGTGNSYRAATWMAETARERGLDGRVIALDAADPAKEITPASLVGLLAPTHGFTAPWRMIWFALNLPRGRGAQAFALLSRGAVKVGRWVVPGLEGTGAYLLALILWLKGYQVRGATGLDMPGAWTTLLPGQSPEAVEFLNIRAHATLLGFIEPILAGRTAFRGLIPLALGLVLLPISAAYLLMGRFFLAKLFYASPRCIGCGQCAWACPVNAIRMKRQGFTLRSGLRPYWTLACESCTRCMNYCPEQAVEASYPFAALLIWLTSLPAAVLLVNRLASVVAPAAGWEKSLAEMIIGYPFHLLVIVLGYSVLFRLLGVPGLNRLLTLLTPTRFYRRYHEPATHLNDIRPHKARRG